MKTDKHITYADVLQDQKVKPTAKLNKNMSLTELNKNRIKTRGLPAKIKTMAQMHNDYIACMSSQKRLDRDNTNYAKETIRSIIGDTDIMAVAKYVKTHHNAMIAYHKDYDNNKNVLKAKNEKINKLQKQLDNTKNYANQLSQVVQQQSNNQNQNPQNQGQ